MIRLALQSEAIDIMNDPRIVERVGFVTNQFNYQPWIAFNDLGHKLLFVFWQATEGAFEFHLTAPRDSIMSCRKLAHEALSWVFSVGAKSIITNCPKGKISNMAEKLGMGLTHCDGNQQYYEVKLWQLAQQ